MSLTCDTIHIFDENNRGLGNFLYLIATTYGIAYKNNLDVKVESLEYFFSKWGDKYKKSLFRNINTEKISGKRNKVYEIKKTRNTYKIFECKNGDELVGYYQSYKYFDFIRPTILSLFSIDDTTKKYISEKYNIILSNYTTISLHVRRADYCNLGISLDTAYQNEAVCYIKNLFVETNIKFLVFSDDINWCRDKFIGDEYYFVQGEDDYVDLYMMSMCNHNIIANSTFSWWGAYLNEKDNKIVIYPKKWFCNNKRYQQIKEDMFLKNWIEI